MAQCPNCGIAIKKDAEECWNCTARFTAPDGWHPLPDGSMPVGEIRTPSQKGKDLVAERAVKRVPDESAFDLARSLAIAAILFWAISLMLPAFLAGGDISYGFPVLLMGLIFGWGVGGWAAYSNIFFIYVLFKLSDRKGTFFATNAMLLLAATVVFFKGPESEAMGRIVSWGIGAFAWLAAILMAAIATGIYLGLYRRTIARALVCALGLCGIGLGVIHVTQRLQANDQDEATYLSRGMVFTFAKFCEAPFVWPREQLIPSNEVVALDLEAKLDLPKLDNFQEMGFLWRVYKLPSSETKLKVRLPEAAARYVLQTRHTDAGAIIRLFDSEKNIALYEQPLQYSYQSFPKYCPASYSSQNAKGYADAIRKLVGQDRGEIKQTALLKPQYADLSCDIGQTEVDGVRGLREWDGRKVLFEPNNILWRTGFCSNNYVALVRVTSRSADPADLGATVQLFDRETLRPVAGFPNRASCPKPAGERCGEVPGKIVKGVRIKESSISVITEYGQIQLQPISK